MDYNLSDFEKALRKSGIQQNDSIFLTTSLGMLGQPRLSKKITRISSLHAEKYIQATDKA